MKRLLFLFGFLVFTLAANGAATDPDMVQFTQRNAAGLQWNTRYLDPGVQITSWAEFAAAVGSGTFDPTAVVGSKTWSNGSTDTFVWTFNRATGVDPTITFGNGVINLSALAIAGTTVTPTATELNFVDGVTSSIQTQLDARLSTANNFSEIAAAGGAAQTSARANLLLGSSDAVAFGSGTFTSGVFSNVRVWTRDAGNITTTLALANTDSLVEATFTDQAAAITLPASPDDGRRILVIGHNTDNGGALVLSIPDGLYNPNRDTDTATSSTTLTIPASSSGTFLLGFVADDTGWLLYDSVGDTYSPTVTLANVGQGSAAAGAYDFGGASVTLEVPNANDPDVTAIGMLSQDANGHWLRAYDGTNQFAVGRKIEQIEITVVDPNGLADAVRDAAFVWRNTSGMSFVVTGWRGFALTDNTTLNIEEIDADGANNATVDAVEIATNGTGIFTGTDDTITAGTVEDGHIILLDFDDTDTPTQVHMTLIGYYNANVN